LNSASKDISEIIKKTADQLVSSQIKKNTQWTKTIFEALTEYAYGKNLRVWSHPNDIDHTIT